jgi:hypothetical protein
MKNECLFYAKFSIFMSLVYCISGEFLSITASAAVLLFSFLNEKRVKKIENEINMYAREHHNTTIRIRCIYVKACGM